MIDRVIHGVCAAILVAQPVLLEVGMSPQLAAAIVAMVGAFFAGYRTDRSQLTEGGDA